ncbi:hypothetical protein BR93DRAFT_934311 [Coniochaeta sp. PMI_546]|nr:hypothetical protein BR93DRAFT_934311 [Coniochaeta sp. PMI_546]
MCFRNIQKSQVCHHWVLGTIIPCDVQQARWAAPKPWYKKIGGDSNPEYCASVRAIELDDPDPNLCPKCIEKRLRTSPQNIHRSGRDISPSAGDTLIRPGPAQRELSETYGIQVWDQKVDWDSLEEQEEDLRKRLAQIDEEARQKRLAAIEASPCLRSSSRPKSESIHTRLTWCQADQGKEPTPEPGVNRRGTNLRNRVMDSREEEKRQKVEGPGSYTPPHDPKLHMPEPWTHREGIDWEVIEDHERHKRKKLETFTQLERQDLEHNPTTKQHRSRALNREDRGEPLFRGEHPNVAYARCLAEQDYQRRKDQEPGLVDPSTVPVDTSWQERTYSGPVVGQAWVQLAKELYPDGDPLAQWRDQEVTLPNTAAVPNPLTVQNRLLMKYGVITQSTSCHERATPQKPANDGRIQTRSSINPPTPHQSRIHGRLSCMEDGNDSLPGPVVTPNKGQSKESRLHYSLPPQPRHASRRRYDEKDDDDNLISPRSAPTPTKPYRERKAGFTSSAPPTERDLSYFAVPIEERSERRQPSKDDIRRRELGESESGSGKDKKSETPRLKRFSLQKRLSNVKGPDSSVSWKSDSSTGSSSSAKSWFMSKLGLSDQNDDTGSFMCRDAARIEGR